MKKKTSPTISATVESDWFRDAFKFKKYIGSVATLDGGMMWGPTTTTTTATTGTLTWKDPLTATTTSWLAVRAAFGFPEEWTPLQRKVILDVILDQIIGV